MSRFSEDAVKQRIVNHSDYSERMTDLYGPSKTDSSRFKFVDSKFEPLSYIRYDKDTHSIVSDFKGYINECLFVNPNSKLILNTVVKSYCDAFNYVAKKNNVANFFIKKKTVTITYNEAKGDFLAGQKVRFEIPYHDVPLNEYSTLDETDTKVPVIGESEKEVSVAETTPDSILGSASLLNESVLENLDTGSLLDSLSVNVLADLSLGS